jgi:hypothetical protein
LGIRQELDQDFRVRPQQVVQPSLSPKRTLSFCLPACALFLKLFEIVVHVRFENVWNIVCDAIEAN